MSQQFGRSSAGKAWAVGAGLVLLCGMTACASTLPTSQAARVPTLRPTVTSARIPRTNDPSVLDELRMGGGGGEGPPPLCTENNNVPGPLDQSGQPIVAVGAYWGETPYQDGGIIPYETVANTDYSAYGWLAIPHVCVSDPAYTTALEITAPDGQKYEPVYAPTEYDQPGAILLPLEAYMQGGSWTVTLSDLRQFSELGMDSFQVTFNIQPLPADIQVGVFPDGRLIASGFDAGEQVVAVLAMRSDDDPFVLVPVNQISLVADENGDLGFEKGGREILYVLVGASGPDHVSIGEGILADEGVPEAVYQRVWGE
jgi:hypothetical protein